MLALTLNQNVEENIHKKMYKLKKTYLNKFLSPALGQSPR